MKGTRPLYNDEIRSLGLEGGLNFQWQYNLYHNLIRSNFSMLYSCVPNQNKEWNVPQSLEMLNSIINNTLASIHSMDKVNHMKADDDRKKVFLPGHIICASILAAYSAEIALKTLIAQVYPKKHPTSFIDNTKDKHNLLCLFNILPSTNQTKVWTIL